MQSRVLLAICALLATVTVAQSWRWFAPEVNCWITQEKVPASWEDARRSCEIEDAVLASPLNLQLFYYMQSLITVHNHSAAYFIGTRANRSDSSQKVHYVSVEGRWLEEMPRAVFDAIDQLDLELGDCLSMDRHGIRAVSCWDHLPYICYSNETTECGLSPATTPEPTTTVPTTTTSAPTTTSTAPTTTSTAPPPGYKYNSATGSYYKFHHNAHKTWYEANATCVSEGAHLVLLNNAEEAGFVSDLIIDANSKVFTWVGLIDIHRGGVSDWRTIHGDPVSEVFQKWYKTQPDDNGTPRCGFLGKITKELYYRPCSFKNFDLFFTCEISQ